MYCVCNKEEIHHENDEKTTTVIAQNEKLPRERSAAKMERQMQKIQTEIQIQPEIQIQKCKKKSHRDEEDLGGEECSKDGENLSQVELFLSQLSQKQFVSVTKLITFSI